MEPDWDTHFLLNVRTAGARISSRYFENIKVEIEHVVACAKGFKNWAPKTIWHEWTDFYLE